VKITSGTADVTDRFSPGSYITLTDSEALNRPPFDVLPSGRVLSLVDPALSVGQIDDSRKLAQIIIRNGLVMNEAEGEHANLLDMLTLVIAASLPPALSDATPLVTATQEAWRATSTPTAFASATAAHQFVRYKKGIAQAAADAAAPLNLAGV
jgi:hypothetical protein